MNLTACLPSATWKAPLPKSAVTSCLDHSVCPQLNEPTMMAILVSGGGTVLGGSAQMTWDPNIDMELSKRIMQRAIQLCPHLVKPGEGIEGLDVIHHSVGLRPVRTGGPRIEWETLPGNLQVVHSYGAGSFGFQSSWGMAFDALKQVNMAFRALSKARALL